MQASALVSELLLHAEKLNRETNTKVADGLTAPADLSNEKANEWHARERAIAAFFVAGILQDYFSDIKAAAKKQMELHGVMKKLEKVEPGSKETIYTSTLVDVVGKCAKPARSIKGESVAGRLRAVLNMPEAEVTQFVEAVTDEKAPARSVEVLPNAGQ